MDYTPGYVIINIYINEFGGEMKGNERFYILAIGFIAFMILTTGCHKKAVTKPDGYSEEQVELGMALVEEWKCSYCHTPEIAGPEGTLIPDPDRLFSGHPEDEEIPPIPDMVITSPEYLEFLDNLDTTVWATDNRIVFTANLTPDDETGIGTWTEDTFIATIRSGQHQGVGKRIKYPMPWQELAELDDQELAAVYAYLRTVKPVSNKVPESIVLFR